MKLYCVHVERRLHRLDEEQPPPGFPETVSPDQPHRRAGRRTRPQTPVCHRLP